MSCFVCPNGKGRMCSGPCGLECFDCPGEDHDDENNVADVCPCSSEESTDADI